MLLKAAFVVLAIWVVGALGVPEAGNLVHVLFLAGLWLLLVGVLKARDAAVHRDTEPGPDKR